MKHLAILWFVLSNCSLFAQEQPKRIDFVLPPPVDSILEPLFNYIDTYGQIDSMVVYWAECPGTSSISKYSFFKVSGSPEFGEDGEVLNRLLWFRNRSNRVLNIGGRFVVPLIFPIDSYTSSGSNKAGRPLIDINTSEYSLYIWFDSAGDEYLHKNWVLEEDSLGQLNLRVSMSTIDSVYVGY